MAIIAKANMKDMEEVAQAILLSMEE